MKLKNPIAIEIGLFSVCELIEAGVDYCDAIFAFNTVKC